MQNLLHDLTKLPEQDDRLVSEGKLLKNKIVELALALDPGLIKLLLKHEGIRRRFFVEVERVLKTGNDFLSKCWIKTCCTCRTAK